MKLIDFFQSAVIPSEARDLTRFEILPDFGGSSLSAQLGMTVLQCGIHRSGSCRTRDDGGKSRSRRSLTAARAWWVHQSRRIPRTSERGFYQQYEQTAFSVSVRARREPVRSPSRC